MTPPGLLPSLTRHRYSPESSATNGEIRRWNSVVSSFTLASSAASDDDGDETASGRPDSESDKEYVATLERKKEGQ